MSDENKTCSSLSSPLSLAQQIAAATLLVIQNFAKFSLPSVIESFFALQRQDFIF